MRKVKRVIDLIEPKKKTLYTLNITKEQSVLLNTWLSKNLWTPYDVNYADFAYKSRDCNVVYYTSTKLVIQGKGTEDFVTFVLEGQITKEARLGYDEVLNPQYFESHAGVDESGKGDLFGPLVSACVVADTDAVRKWVDEGLKESKKVTSDTAVMAMAKKIRATKNVAIKVSYANMTKYNELYNRFGNLNKMLAWMHAKSVEGALAEKHVKWGMLDQFTKQALVQKQLNIDDFELKMETKAERDPVVAAASIIARATYVYAMNKLSEECSIKLKKGASAQVKEQAVEIIKKFGKDALPKFAKMHFKTAKEALYNS
ncbi:MAG: ribonuclease HIII [Opitutales bacterium]